MSGWHPEQADGGALPNAQDPNNPAQAFEPIRPPIGTAARYYGNGCDVRLRPAVINTLISENLALVDSVGMNYNPASLLNLRTATEYVVQKGLPKWVALTAQGVPTNYYRGALSPPLLGGLNNGMVLTIIPSATNQGFVRVDVGNNSWVPVLRNDARELESEDWPANVPQIIGYANGAFYMLGLAKSQVPIVLKGAIYFYVRPDGNDATGDGTANTPQRAFRTLNGAWYAVGSRYSASPTSHIGFILGIPGDYEGATLGPYGSSVSVQGDRNNFGAYRIHSWDQPPGTSHCLHTTGIGSFSLIGVTLVMDVNSSSAWGNFGWNCWGPGTVGADNVEIRAAVAQPFTSYFLFLNVNSTFAETQRYMGDPIPSAQIRFIGNGITTNAAIIMQQSIVTDYPAGWFQPSTFYFENLNFKEAGWCLTMAATFGISNRNVIQAGCTGRQYVVADRSTLSLAGRVPPGNQAGALGAFSTVV